MGERLEQKTSLLFAVFNSLLLPKTLHFIIPFTPALGEEVEKIKASLSDGEECNVEYDDDIYYKGFLTTEKKAFQLLFHLQIRWAW